MRDPIDLFPLAGEGAPDPSLPRLPAFLAVYGPAQGYAVETTFTDLFSLKPGVLQLLAATPSLALPAAEQTALIGSSGQTLVCRASLRDPQGRVLATATAARAILAAQDVELLETAARRRLAAALGFGEEVLPPIPGEPEVDPVGAVAPAAASNPDVDESAAADTAPPGRKPVAPPASSPVAPASPDAPPPDAATALALLRRQLAHLAKTRGVEPPAVATKAEAHAAIKALLRPAAA